MEVCMLTLKKLQVQTLTRLKWLKMLVVYMYDVVWELKLKQLKRKKNLILAQPLHHLSVLVALPKVTMWSWLVYRHTHMHTAATVAYGMETARESSAFVVQICQKHPAEALITAGQQSVNHYRDSAVWFSLSQYCKIYPKFVLLIYKIPI